MRIGPQDHLRSSARRGITICNEPAPAPSLRLCLADGRHVSLDRRLEIGSMPGSDVELSDPHVSGTHCVIFREGSRTYLRDCGSSNGTYLGAVRIEALELQPGIAITVGRTALRVVSGDAPHAAGDGSGGAGVDPHGMIGNGRALCRLRKEIACVSGSSAAVLLLGESGTGKELASRAIHATSGRTGSFVAVNCGALSSQLAESELFGHERGAFTGAVARKVGFFEEADGGTLFFDEIAELPLLLQPKLLRVLETKQVRAVGGHGERRVDVRIVAATHQDLSAGVLRGTFRRDLYHRLSTIELQLPTLRDRLEDMPALIEHFLAELSGERGRLRITPHAMAKLVAHTWPGNIRELRNALQHAAIFGETTTIDAHDLPRSALSWGTQTPSPRAVESAPSYGFAPTLQHPSEHERDTVLEALRRHGTQRKAAQAIGMPKSTFCDKVRRYRSPARDLPAAAAATTGGEPG